MAQVEEKRKKKQLEEEKRKLEEQEEEQRLAREKERMQKQFEEDKQKKKQKEVGFCLVQRDGNFLLTCMNVLNLILQVVGRPMR